MELFINDLSLHAQFPDPTTFREALRTLFSCHQCARSFNRACYVPRSISTRMVGHTLPFRQAITAFGDINFTRQVMVWIDRQGPFADDVLIRDPNEYYTYGDEIVTDEILGEVAARQNGERPSAIVSFKPSAFTLSPLPVLWHRSDTDKETIPIDNFWDRQTLHSYLEQHDAEIQSWSDMLARARSRFTQLTFFDNLENHLQGEPFSQTIARRALELLDILNRLKTCYTATGERTAEGELLIDNYFRRTNCFSDSSDTEKNTAVYRAAMTFRLSDGTALECFWHAKINYRYFRIHFSPIEAHQPLYIAYIGPKLTKK